VTSVYFSSLKGGARRFSAKSALPLLWETFKVTAPPVTCSVAEKIDCPIGMEKKRSVGTGHNSAKGFLVHFLRAFFRPSANITTC